MKQCIAVRELKPAQGAVFLEQGYKARFWFSCPFFPFLFAGASRLCSFPVSYPVDFLYCFLQVFMLLRCINLQKVQRCFHLSDWHRREFCRHFVLTLETHRLGFSPGLGLDLWETPAGNISHHIPHEYKPILCVYAFVLCDCVFPAVFWTVLFGDNWAFQLNIGWLLAVRAFMGNDGLLLKSP